MEINMGKQEIGPRERQLKEMREARYGGLQAKATPTTKLRKQVEKIRPTKAKKKRAATRRNPR
jgi:hypothetical protein